MQPIQNIQAAGDVTGGPGGVYVATSRGRIAAYHARQTRHADRHARGAGLTCAEKVIGTHTMITRLHGVTTVEVNYAKRRR